MNGVLTFIAQRGATMLTGGIGTMFVLSPDELSVLQVVIAAIILQSIDGTLSWGKKRSKR